MAARFAAKEAVWKALNHVDKNLLITDISVKNTSSGAPEIYIRNEKREDIKISLSHTETHAVAAAVIL